MLLSVVVVVVGFLLLFEKYYLLGSVFLQHNSICLEGMKDRQLIDWLNSRLIQDRFVCSLPRDRELLFSYTQV